MTTIRDRREPWRHWIARLAAASALSASSTIFAPSRRGCAGCAPAAAGVGGTRIPKKRLSPDVQVPAPCGILAYRAKPHGAHGFYG